MVKWMIKNAARGQGKQTQILNNNNVNSPLKMLDHVSVRLFVTLKEGVASGTSMKRRQSW